MRLKEMIDVKAQHTTWKKVALNTCQFLLLACPSCSLLPCTPITHRCSLYNDKCVALTQSCPVLHRK